MNAESLNMWTLGFTALSAVAAALSAVAAFWTIKKTMEAARRERELAEAARRNERLFDHTLLILERAFTALMGASPDAVIPTADRLNWLTAARLIMEFKAMKALITDTHLQDELQSHEFHWRHQFYLKLVGISPTDNGYFDWRNPPIDPASAVVVFEFADWPDGRIDPLAEYRDGNHAAEQLGVHPRWLMLQLYLNKERQAQ